MRIATLQLENYRNYTKQKIEFGGSLNIFKGANASGKTNLLEAVSFFVLGKSFRAQDAFLVSYEKPAAHITLNLNEPEQNELKVSLGIGEKGFQKIWKKNKLESHYSYLRHDLLGVLFLPTDTELVTHAPHRRRQFLNRVLAQIDRDYAHNLFQYKKTLQQRAFALKRVRQHYAPPKELDVWDETLVKYAVPLILARAALVKKINRYLPEIYSKVAQAPTELTIKYIPFPPEILLEDNPAAKLLEHLIATRELDLSRVCTRVGPHRDDWQFILGGRLLNETGSRGEQRSAIVALKVAEARVIEEISRTKPILLLDDVLSELDQHRRETLLDVVKDYQAIITTTDVNFLAQSEASIGAGTKIFQVQQGEIELLDSSKVEELIN